MAESGAVKTMRLRYAGSCVGCAQPLSVGDRAHWLRTSKTVRCLSCGPVDDPTSEPAARAGAPMARPPTAGALRPLVSEQQTPAGPVVRELIQGELPRPATCGDCARRLRRGAEALHDADVREVLCLECVTLDTLHHLGVPGAGARREHRKRADRHHTRVRTAHPRLGGVILALSDDPHHVRAWQTGAAGEEEFGNRLSADARRDLKVLHDRKVPRSSANIDHLAITPDAVWVLDAKRYKGKVETRGHGIFSARPPDLYVGGRDQTKLVDGVRRQVETVRSVLAPLASELDMSAPPPVRGALVFVDAEFGMFPKPFAVEGVWVGWGRAVRKLLTEPSDGRLAVDAVAKRLARELRAG